LLWSSLQVLLEKEYVSCCVRVQNLQRSVIAVPANDALSDPELPELETAVPAGKPNPALFKKLHALSSAMKQELQQVLISRGIEHFSFLPVKKTYTFERADVPKGGGYFLELNYPYMCPPLEADLTGEHFTALFGTHTSALELLLLQREMMGPGWLLIAKPQRVASSPVRPPCAASAQKNGDSMSHSDFVI
jgi:DNA polymerase alpha subunit A